MAYSAAELLKLQANIKRDPDGYRDEFLLQYRHYQACLQIFQLHPNQDSKEFAEFITFIAQVSKVYPTSTAAFAPELMSLLEAQGGRLDPPLRRSMVSSLILLRNRNQLDPLLLLPLLFKLFRVNDKALREMLFRHIIADLKSSNKKGRNERLNRGVQSFLYNMVNGDESELAAKKALAVLSELWRRRIWRDARTVNCIASAVFHKSPRVMAAALKFFLGQDAAAAADDDEEEDEDEDAGAKAASGGNKGVTAVAAPTKEEVYKAMHKGTKSSKRKKQAKLKRVMSSLKKHARREAAAGNEGFAALHLLHDPQGFAERLFSRLQVSRERWETRLDMMMVLSRVVGVHKLLLLNVYPFLQKYIAPHQRDVTVVLAALVQGVHELVPPDSLAPVLRQLVDQFVHDRARPEVMTVGLKSVRELCLRCPLVMTPELLQDLSEYKKFRDKEVATAARGLIGAFRELNPELLAKKDRGRGADLTSGPAAYGAAAVSERLEGADLLEAALAAGTECSDGSSDDEDGSGSSDDEGGSDGGSSSDDGSDVAGSDDGSSEEEGEDGGSGSGSGEEEEEELGSEEAAAAEAAAAEGGSSGSEDGEEEGAGTSSSSGDEADEAAAAAAAGEQQNGSSPQTQTPRKQQPQQPGSLASLKKQLAAAKKQQQGGDDGEGEQQQQEQQLPIEMTRILTEDDFKRIRELKRKAIINAALTRHGLASSQSNKKSNEPSEAKKKRLLAAAEAEADEALALAGKRAKLSEAQVAPDDLTGRHKKRKDKQERLASVMSGREGREAFGARSKLKKNKTGGLSERQKQRTKAMPIAARVQQLKNRSTRARQKNNPRHHKGHFRK